MTDEDLAGALKALSEGGLLRALSATPRGAVGTFRSFEILQSGEEFGIYHRGLLRLGMFDTLEVARVNRMRVFCPE